jgi:DNA-binding NtrC family response regulator
MAGLALPVILMTGDDDQTLRQQAMELGCVAYLRKPLCQRLLFEAITEVSTTTVSDGEIRDCSCFLCQENWWRPSRIVMTKSWHETCSRAHSFV